MRRITDNSVDIEWNTPYDDGGRHITGYHIECRDADAASSSWQRVASVDAYSRFCTVTGLRERHNYLLRVFSVNEQGTSDALEIDAPVTILMEAGEDPG